jgi:putative transposase
MAILHNGKWYAERISHRTAFHDYSSTASYLITMVTSKREPFFDIPALYGIADKTWHMLPERFPNITLDEFVIMPDHIHLIIHIKKDEKGTGLDDVIKAYKSLVFHDWLAAIQSMGPKGTSYTARIWQRNYDDRIIDDQQRLDYARIYVRNNPVKLLQKK